MPVELDPSYELKYIALGDSYTIGQSVATSERYPNILAQKLKDDSISLDTTIIIAKTGWRTDNLQSAIESINLLDTFELVSLLIGVNNQYQGKPISQYESEFRELLEIAINLAGGIESNVFVLSIPDYGYTPFGENDQMVISEEIDAYNKINERITKDYGISWFDITPISRNGLSKPELVASDGLHPSGEMYSQWVDLIYNNVKSKLE
ncbi:MAG: SGNH/GDSL hydrolase family protein [Flavobacteriales bacterium]|nr:SGNH/GDSL hydrolase family protein [Flavobacteriales bacterium]